MICISIFISIWWGFCSRNRGFCFSNPFFCVRNLCGFEQAVCRFDADQRPFGNLFETRLDADGGQYPLLLQHRAVEEADVHAEIDDFPYPPFVQPDGEADVETKITVEVGVIAVSPINLAKDG